VRIPTADESNVTSLSVGYIKRSVTLEQGRGHEEQSEGAGCLKILGKLTSKGTVHRDIFL